MLTNHHVCCVLRHSISVWQPHLLTYIRQESFMSHLLSGSNASGRLASSILRYGLTHFDPCKNLKLKRQHLAKESSNWSNFVSIFWFPPPPRPKKKKRPPPPPPKKKKKTASIGSIKLSPRNTWAHQTSPSARTLSAGKSTTSPPSSSWGLENTEGWEEASIFLGEKNMFFKYFLEIFVWFPSKHSSID